MICVYTMLKENMFTQQIYFINLLLNCTGVSFTKLCDALYDQLTHRRSHKLILLTNCYIALGYVTCSLPCVAPYYAVRRELRWYQRTGRTILTYKHLCERPPPQVMEFEHKINVCLFVICIEICPEASRSRSRPS